MTQELAEPGRWQTRRWWILIGLVFATQIGLIFWLGKPHHVVYSHKQFAPTIQVAGNNTAPELAFNDPTLFALPHQEGFSGPAWLTISNQEFQPFLWSEPPLLLSLNQERLGQDFRTFMSTNEVSGFPVISQPELKLKIPALATEPPLVTLSTLRLTGDLAGRRFLVEPRLRAWPSAEILSNTVVQLLVAADGKPISPILLKAPGSASTEADQYALLEAYRVRFEPVPSADPLNPVGGIALGQLVFEWQTLPLADTNTPAPPK